MRAHERIDRWADRVCYLEAKIRRLELRMEVEAGTVHAGPVITAVQSTVAEFYGIPVEAMRSKQRPDHIAHPRQVAMKLCRDNGRFSLGQIGAAFGGRDHGTVIHACQAVKSRCETDAAYAADVAAVSAKVASAVAKAKETIRANGSQ